MGTVNIIQLCAYPNSRYFHVAKGAWTIKVGLYYLSAASFEDRSKAEWPMYVYMCIHSEPIIHDGWTIVAMYM